MKWKPKKEEKVVMREAGEAFVTEQKGSCAHGTESQTLMAGVCSKARVYCWVPSKGVGDKSWIHSELVFE